MDTGNYFNSFFFLFKIFKIMFCFFQVEFQEKQEKLLEQLEEARKLRQSIFRRAQVVFRTLAKYLPDSALEGFGGFIKEKIRLILDTRQLTEGLKNMEEIIKCLKEYSNGVMII